MLIALQFRNLASVIVLNLGLQSHSYSRVILQNLHPIVLPDAVAIDRSTGFEIHRVVGVESAAVGSDYNGVCVSQNIVYVTISRPESEVN